MRRRYARDPAARAEPERKVRDRARLTRGGGSSGAGGVGARSVGVAALPDHLGVHPAETDLAVVDPAHQRWLVRAVRAGRIILRRDRSANRFDHPTLPVGDDEPGRIVGVTADAELALMMETMVLRAQAHQVPGVGRPSVDPVPDVVDLHEPVVGATRHPAPAVAPHHHPPGALGHDPLCPPDREGHTVALPHRLDRAVAHEPIADVRGQQPTIGRRRVRTRDVDVHPRLGPLATRRSGDAVEIAIAHLDQAVGDRDVGLAVLVQRLASGDQRLFDGLAATEVELATDAPPMLFGDRGGHALAIVG